MKRFAVILTVAATLAGCQTTKTEPDTVYWRNWELYDQVQAGRISKIEAQSSFEKTMAACRNEGLKVSVPPPSCTQAIKPDCTGMTGAALGFCRGYVPPPNCDYSAYNYAMQSQDDVYKNCMSLAGYRHYSVPAGENPKAYIDQYRDRDSGSTAAAPHHFAATDAAPVDENPDLAMLELQEAIDGIPRLAEWQKEQSTKWGLAMSIDDQLRSMPAYQGLTIRERLLIVVERVEQASR